MKKIPQKEWVWDGRPGHFYDSDNCSFNLTTRVGNVAISTIGMWVPNGHRKPVPLGGGRKNGFYETMVFPSQGIDYNGVGEVLSWNEVDVEQYVCLADAVAGHKKMCSKWSKGRKQKSALKPKEKING